MNMILGTLLFYGCIILMLFAVIKGFFKYRKVKVMWQGRERTLYYRAEERVVPGGSMYDCKLTDPHLLFFTFDSHIWINVENGRVTLVYVIFHGNNFLAKKSWLRDMIMRAPKKMDIMSAIDAVKEKSSGCPDARFVRLVRELTDPEYKCMQQLVDQIPALREADDAEKVIGKLPEKE